MIKFDGVGNVIAHFSYSYNGSIGYTGNYTGTYTVNPDCRGKVIATPGSGNASVWMAIVSGGAEVLASNISPGGTWTLDAKKQ